MVLYQGMSKLKYLRLTIFALFLMTGVVGAGIWDFFLKPKTFKQTPEWLFIDIRAWDMYQEFIELSARNNIHFTHNVSVGFKKINKGDVIGQCHYLRGHREVDLDLAWWNSHTYIESKFLLFHELAHCLCTRDHDFGNGEQFVTDPVQKWFFKNLEDFFGVTRKGFYKDGCPMSIMAPEIASYDCLLKYGQEYKKEMLNRCVAW